MKKWEIYLADVPFEDVPETKLRPVLILGETVVAIECLKMTSQPPRPGEYVLKNWRGAGLLKPTTVRLSKRLILPKSNLRKKIGMLSIVDIANIQKLIS